MSTAREELPYDAGLGTGGKFRKRPFRRSQAATPYDRPPTALRNPTTASNGWLSKLVDPAHRLITAGAHRLFSSVFRKRLPPPPQSPLLPPPEANQEPRDEFKDAISSDPSGAQEAHINANKNPSNSSNHGGLIELEQILKHKTFTRSEVERLTSLLRSRANETSVDSGDKRSEENRFEVIPPKSMVFHDRKEGYPNTPRRENGIRNQLASTSVISETVLAEDVASPAEVAKAFMGSRLPKVSPSTLSLRSQALREDSSVISNPHFPPKSHIIPLVQRSHAAVPANGFLTPRSRGRSAIYNMARTPYSRVQQTSTHKGAGAMINSFGAPSSSMTSQYEGDLSRPSGSRQGALKRGSSVLENDIGSVGPMRRIRQKSDLTSRKGLSSPVSSQHPSSSLKIVAENGDISKPGSSFTPIPSKSKEMASKILEHLDKFTPKGKSPTKLSPAMLRGKALRSLENPDSSKVFENVHHNYKLDDSVNSRAPVAQQSVSHNNDQSDRNGPTKIIALFDKDAPAENGSDVTVPVKDTVPTVNANGLHNTIPHSPQKNQAFKMSAHEDFLDLDDDIVSNVAVSTPSTEAREKLGNSVSESKTMVPKAVNVDEPPALSEVKPSTSFILNPKLNLSSSNGSAVTEKCTDLALPTSSSMTVQPAVEATQTFSASDKDVLSKESTAPNPIFSFGDKIAAPKEPSAVPTFGLGSKDSDKVPLPAFTFSSSLTDSSSAKFGNSSDPKPGSFSSFVTASGGPIDSVPRVSESAEALTEHNLKSEVLSKTPEPVSTSMPVAGLVAFGGADNSSVNNGSLSSSPSLLSSSVPPLFSSNTTSLNSSSATFSATLTSGTTATTSSSLPVFTPVSATSVSNFGSSAVASNSVVAASGASGEETMQAKVKQETISGNTSSTLFGVQATGSNTAGSVFGFSAAAPSTASSQSQGSTPFGGSSESRSSTVSGVATITQGTPVQFGSSGSSPLFGSSGSSASSSLFGTGATLFSSGAGIGSSSFASSSDGNTVSSSSGTASSTLFGSSWQQQPSKSPIFPSFNTTPSSTGFSFGASTASVAATSSASLTFGSSSTSVAATNSAPMPFGASPSTVAATNSVSMPFGSSTPSGTVTNNAPMLFGSTPGGTGSSGSLFPFTAAATNGTTSGSGFSFTSASPTSSSQPSFGNPNPVFGFGNPSPVGNDQMSMEDSMAEDTVQASTPKVPTFSQQPFSPAPSSFVFGSGPQAGTNPFQFGGQQTQQASPFQASGSLDFNASGNFSLGTGGGDKSNRKIVKINKSKHRRK